MDDVQYYFVDDPVLPFVVGLRAEYREDPIESQLAMADYFAVFMVVADAVVSPTAAEVLQNKALEVGIGELMDREGLRQTYMVIFGDLQLLPPLGKRHLSAAIIDNYLLKNLALEIQAAINPFINAIPGDERGGYLKVAMERLSRWFWGAPRPGSRQLPST